MHKLARLAVVATALTAAAPAAAATIFTATLTNAAENPPANPTLTTGAPRPASFGSAVLILNDAMTALTYSISVFNIDFTGSQTADINDNLTAAHIHGGTAVTPTTNGPVVFGFIGLPFNETAPNDVVVTPFTDAVGGMVTGTWNAGEGQNTTLTAQLANLFAERTYLNFHTRQFGGGEVRGTIVVPEPPSWSLLLLGVGALGFAMTPRPARRRIRTA